MHSIQRLVISIFLGLGLGVLSQPLYWSITPSNAIAQVQSYDQSHQSMSQSASLEASDPDMEIAIYPQPDTRKPPIGYGLNGDAVAVLEQTRRNDGTIWNRIQFEASPDSEGWVQLQYLSIQSTNQQSQGNQAHDSPGGYMGNRTAQQSSQPSSRSQNSQSDRASYYQQDWHQPVQHQPVQHQPVQRQSNQR